MKSEHESLAELTAQYNKFKFHRTVLVLCELYFAYSYSTDFSQGTAGYRIFMGGILAGIASLALYAHIKMQQLHRKILVERQKDENLVD